MRTMLRSKVTLLFLAFAVAIFAVAGMAMAQTTDTSGSTAAAPTIQSDKADYAPGELVTLTGSGWQPGETVNIKVNDTYGASWSRNVDVTADASGNITDSFNLPDWFVSDYDVTATGASGAIAKTTFTDAASLTLSPTSGLPGTTVMVTSGGGAYDANANNIGIYWDGTLGTTNGTLVDTCSANNGGNIIAGSGCSFTVPAGSTVGAHTVVSTQQNKPGISASTTFNVTAPACTAPSVTTQPSNQSITYGANASFTAAASGTSPTVQWQKSTNNGTTWNNVSGVTSTTLTLTKPSVSDSGSKYRAVFTNNCGSATSNGSATLQVAQKPITGSFTADNKEYDGTTAATVLTRSVNQADVVGTDVVSLTGGNATFNTKDVGTGKTVTLSGASLSGTDAGNYVLASGPITDTADITAKTVTGSFTADDKEYDGDTSATVLTRSVSGEMPVKASASPVAQPPSATRTSGPPRPSHSPAHR